MTLLEGFGTRPPALVWNAEEDTADAVLSSVEGREVAWVWLMAGGDNEAVIARWKQQSLAVEGQRRRGDLGKGTLVFVGLESSAWAGPPSPAPSAVREEAQPQPLQPPSKFGGPVVAEGGWAAVRANEPDSFRFAPPRHTP